MSPCRLFTFFCFIFCLLLGPGQAVAAVSTSDLAGTWQGTMTGSTANPINFICNSSGTILSGQETLSDGSTVRVSGSLTVGANGAVTGTMIFTFANGSSVQATTRSVTLTIITNPSRLRLAGALNATYQPSGTDTLSVTRVEPYVPPAPDVALSRGGSPIGQNGTDAYPFIGVVAVSQQFTYTLTNSGNLTLTVGSVSASQQVNCSVVVNTSPSGSIAAGGSSTLVLSVTPTAAGAWSCVVSFATNDPDENPATWTITGSATATPQPELQIQREGITISNGANEVLQNAVTLGQNLVLSYVVTNLGSAALEVGPLVLSGFNNCTVTVDVAGMTTVPARGASTFALTIRPTAAGPWSFSVSEPSNDSSEPTTNWSISGTAREVVNINDQRSCGIGGGFALFLLACGLAGMSLFAGRFHARQPSGLVRSTAIAALLLSASRASAVEWNADVDWDDKGRHDTSPVSDWRIGYAMLPTAVDITLLDKSDSGFNPNYNLETNWDQAGRSGVMWMTPWSDSGVAENGDFIVGLELSTNHCVLEAGANSPEIDLRTFQLSVHPGWWFLPFEKFHIEINPFVSLGYAQFDFEALGSGGDLYYELGLRFGSYYTWSNGLQLGLQTGYLYGVTKGESSGGGFKYDTDIKFQGLFLGVQLGYRL